VADYVHFASPAAVWAQYEVGRLLAGRPIDPDAALSYVALREGLERAAASDAERARACFRRAILLNRQNWAAYLSLAKVDGGAEDTYLRSLETLEYGLSEMREHWDGAGGASSPGGHPFLGDVNYFRMGYALAAQLANGEMDPDLGKVLRERDAEAQTVEEICARFIADADEAVEWYRSRNHRGLGPIWRGLKPSEERLWKFLTDTVRPSLKVLLAMALLKGDPIAAKAKVAEVREMESAPAAQRGNPSYRVLYNLASFEASPKHPGSKVPVDAARAIEDLQAALREAPGSRRAELLDAARADRSFVLLRERAEFKQLQEVLGAADKPSAKGERRWWCTSGS
jgi:hypothetical protein